MFDTYFQRNEEKQFYDPVSPKRLEYGHGEKPNEQ